jgi:glucokinase
VNEKEFTIGVDIGGTNTVVGVVGRDGISSIKLTFPTTGHKNVEEFIKRLTASIDKLRRKIPSGSSLRGIGLAAPAARHREGIIKDPANLQWGTVNLVDILKRHYGLPTAITNDSNAAALGEMNYGAGKGMQNFVVLTLGTGLGAGVVMDGRLMYGNNDMAGELGHITLEPGGRQCGCMRRGCAETYVSASGLRRTAFDLLVRDNDDSRMRDVSFNQLSSKMIYDFAYEGDNLALKTFAVTGDYLGRLLANTVAALDPEAVILSGGLAEAGDLLLHPTKKSFEENVLGLHKGTVEILKSAMSNGDAAILGASCLVLEGAGPSVRQESSQRLVAQV